MNELIIPDYYKKTVKSRSLLKYYKGLLVRAQKRFVFSVVCKYARMKGATIGRNSIIPFALAKKANANLIVGDDVIIETSDIDLRSKVQIMDHVIINKNVSIIRVSHVIDDCPTYDTKYYADLVVRPYSWLATSSTVLPSVSCIDTGSVIGACAVLVRDTEENGVYSGNPAKLLRKHQGTFDELVVCGLMGGDFHYYKTARK